MNDQHTSNRELLSNVWTHLTEVRAVRGKGIYIYDKEGTEYMDFTSGIGVTNTGHCHPNIVRAIRSQAEQLLFAQMNCVLPEPSLILAEKLNQVTPENFSSFFFSNSGAEATEASIKLARAATGRTNIIVFQGSFHGRTHMAMAMTTSKTIYRERFQPLPAGIFVAPFPYSHFYGWPEEDTVAFCLKQLDLVLSGQTAPHETAAIIIEPVLGEGGYVPAPASFLKALREVCDLHGILLIIDEVQSGFGRTGTFFCYEQANVRADILVMAKGLGSGLPISGIAASKALMDLWKPGTHGGTYGGGSMVPVAAAIATIDTLREENLVENAAQQGKLLMEALQVLQSKYPIITDVRGKGLMIGVEFDNALNTSKTLSNCLEQRLLLLSCGTYKNVIRWIPPLTVSERQLRQALLIFEKALDKASN
ncbi:aspartate aminotransferase family protein [Maribacter sp. 2-571]|uniref:aspartate aminotransferase family protein n=1 Tax=Maribacter sp. 2-571 TaxID=3417569 RepID=UPI003D34A722